MVLVVDDSLYGRAACLQVAAAHSVWQSLQAMLRINRFWGIIVFGWVPLASLVAAFVTIIAGVTYWYMTDSKSKKGLLGAQVGWTVCRPV